MTIRHIPTEKTLNRLGLTTKEKLNGEPTVPLADALDEALDDAIENDEFDEKL